MYKSFEVLNFRCFSKLLLKDLERVNLIAGANNVGKTALLEALFVHCAAYNPNSILTIHGLRGFERVTFEIGTKDETAGTFWGSVFKEFDVDKEIQLTGKNNGFKRALKLKVIRKQNELANIRRFVLAQSKPEIHLDPQVATVLELESIEDKQPGKKYYAIADPTGFRLEPIPPAPPFPTLFLAARHSYSKDDAERFGKLQISKQQNIIPELLKIVEPRLQKLESAPVGGVSMLHGDIGLARLVPLPLLGGGTNRLAAILIDIANTPRGVFLVDEIENGFHHAILPKVWQAIGKIAQQVDAQVFATTHSWECIVAAHKAFSNADSYDFRLHRLDRVNGEVHAKNYDKSTLEAAIETGLEVR